MSHLAHCQASNKAMVIGTTGLSSDQQQAIQAAATKIPIMYAPNMSVSLSNLYINFIPKHSCRLFQ